MALTLITRETFQGVGTLSSSTPGNLGTVTGNFYKRAVGPRLSSDTTANSAGWSADLRQVTQASTIVKHKFATVKDTLTERAGAFSAWYYIDNFQANSNACFLSSLIKTNGNHILHVMAKPQTNGNFWYNCKQVSYANTDSGVVIPIRQWFELRIAWNNTQASGYYPFTYLYSAFYRLAGSSTWVNIYTSPSTLDNDQQLDTISGGANNAGGSESKMIARYGMPSIYRLGAYADRFDLVSDVVDPVAGARQWYVNPVTGSDTNDGATSTSAWASVTMINAESAELGMFPTASGYASGDILTIDTTAANLVLGGSSLTINTRGLNVVQLGGGLTGTGEIQAWKALANASFSLTSGTTKVYQITDSETAIVPWEDDKWLAHITGANFTAVKATLESTAGSFWTDGTTLYIHPFGDTNPATDGKVYTRSYYRSGGFPGVLMSVPDIHLNGLRVRKTCIADPITNDPGSNYCYQGQSAFGGTTLIENCYGDYGSKHIFGFTDNDLARTVTVTNCRAEQGSPYSSQSPWVDYSSLNATGTSTTVYNNCRTDRTTGLVGSTTGKTLPDQVWLSHNNGSSLYQFARITFNSCAFNGTVDTYGAVASLRFNGGSCAGGIIRSPDAIINRTLISGICFSQDANGGALTVTDSILIPTVMNGGSPLNAQGTIFYQGCTFDLRATTTNSNDISIWKRVAALAFTLKDCAFFFSATYRFGLLQDAVSTDTITFDHNCYQLGATTSIVYNYNDGSTTAARSFAQWQALGKDASSLTSSDVKVDAGYYPLGGSPLNGLGNNRGQAVDYSGKTVNRVSIGALEMVLTTLFRLAMRPAVSAVIRSAVKIYKTTL